MENDAQNRTISTVIEALLPDIQEASLKRREQLIENKYMLLRMQDKILWYKTVIGIMWLMIVALLSALAWLLTG